MRTLICLGLATLLVACTPPEESGAASESPAPTEPTTAAGNPTTERCDNFAEHGMPLFGDVHVHTSFSFDAAANSTGATPADANRYARGEAIPFFPIDADGKPTGTTQIDRPLDFLAVTDHGEFLGERAICRTPGSPVYDSQFCQAYRANERQGMLMLGSVITTETPARIPDICGADGSQCLDFAKTPWQIIKDTANEANDPCQFSSFIAYEYTGTPGTSNYHRNVIFRGDKVPDLPVSYIDAPIDSKLWAGLDAVCKEDEGCDYLTIPHNTNLANGRMSPYRQLEPTPENKLAYANKRLQREPIMEIFQHKGNSECVNGLTSILGQPDELCDVESVRRMGENKGYTSGTMVDGEMQMTQVFEVTRECGPDEKGANGMLGAGCIHATDFQRSALVVGLKEEEEIGANPIKLGIIAATDTHTATPGGAMEDGWPGAVTGESTPQERLQPGLLTSGIDGNPGGLAGVWAKENTRDAIFDAMLRREVFGTSGTRIVPRLFAGWDYPENLCDATDMIDVAYADGVPMGGDLSAAPNDGSPKFLLYAAQDPNSAPLQALHLIKGWVDGEGAMHTAVVPVATNESGAGTLCQVFSDPEFDPSQSAYYYMRAVEPASPRWHTYDCAQIPEDQQPEVCSNGEYPDMIHEMAWTSPIWYRKP